MKLKINYILLLIIFFGVNWSVGQTVHDKAVSNSTSQNSEGEAHIAINPNDPKQMVMGFMETGGALDFKIYTSSDSGNSWKKSNFSTKTILSTDFPGHSVIGGGDVVFAYDKTGELYCTWIYLLSNQNAPAPFDSCVWTSYWAKSVDNGKNFTLANGNDHFWGRGKIKLSSAGGIQAIHNFADGICDRQWLAIDHSNGPHQNKLYIGYINYPSNLQQTGLKVKSKAKNQTSFSNAATAYPGNGQLTNILVDKKGTLHYTFGNVATQKVYHVSSTDGGQTFSDPHLIANGTRLMPQSNRLINNRENAAPSLTLDGAGTLHLVWNDFPTGNTFPTAHYSKSTDDGVTWSSPVDISTILKGNVFMPVISSSKNKITIGANVLDANKKSNYYIATSMNNGNNFNSPVKISSGITDYSNATVKQGFVGDYSSAVRTDCNIYSLWTDCRNGCKQYIAKYDECLATGIAELAPIDGSFVISNLFPVPARDVLNIQIENKQNNKIQVQVYNIKGQVVYSHRLEISKGKSEFKIDLKDLAKGQYVLKLEATDGSFQTKVFTKTH